MTPEKSVTEDRQLFSRNEFIAAFSLIAARKRAERWTDELLEADSDNVHGYANLSDDVLDLLSLISESCAERVRQLFEQTPEQAVERRAHVRARFGLPERAHPRDGK